MNFQRIGLWSGVAAAALFVLTDPPDGFPAPAWKVAGVALLMAAWWVTEALPLAATALVPIAILPLLGILPLERIASPYANPLIFLFLGGFLIARAMEQSGLHRRLAEVDRELAHDPEILILDEATSSVDTETEGHIRRAIDRLMQGRTSIVIAHRLSTIQSCDKIVVLHKGRVREVGTHQELLSQKGFYFKLYQLQYKDQEVLTREAL